MSSRPFNPFDPSADAGPGRRAAPRDAGAVDLAPDEQSMLGPRHRERGLSVDELAAHGYAGQGYPLYGQPQAPSGEAAAPSGSRGEAPTEAAAPDTSEAPADRDAPMPWHADPASSAFAFGYTTSLGASNPAPAARGRAGTSPEAERCADARVREDVCARLSDDDALDASQIRVDVRGGEVTLGGAVLERRDRRRAEDLAASVPGVLAVHDQLRVHKGLWRELRETLAGGAEGRHHGHHGSGTRDGG